MRRMAGQTVLVTGGNRGLGLEACRQLAELGARVVLASRDESKGRAAADGLVGAGGQVSACRLDVTRPEDIEATAAFVGGELGGLDALVNNAGIALDGFDERVARRTLETNTLGPMALTDALVPHLREHGRVVNVSSGLGDLSGVSSSLRARFLDEALTRAGLRALLDEFVAAVAAGRHRAAGWPSSAYGVSKIGLNTYTRILARELAESGRLVNAVCPGWVRTDMGGRSAPRSVISGADSVVWASALPADGPTGGFFRDRRPIGW